MDWPAILTAVGLFAVYVVFGLIMFAPFWLSGQLSEQERREIANRFPNHGSKNNSKKWTAQ